MIFSCVASHGLTEKQGHLNGLFHMARAGEGHSFYIQQHPIREVWNGPSGLLRRALQIWTEAEGQIAHSAFDEIRPYQLTFRHGEGTWICVEIGDKSSYASWYGREWSLSSVGRPLPIDARRRYLDPAVDAAL